MAHLTLSEFLLARITEDEGRALGAEASMDAFDRKLWRWLGGYDAEVTEANYAYIDAMPPARVLAECKAKRAIIEAGMRTRPDGTREEIGCWTAWGEGQDCSAYDAALRALAAVYADHPDFNPEWSA